VKRFLTSKIVSGEKRANRRESKQTLPGAKIDLASLDDPHERASNWSILTDENSESAQNPTGRVDDERYSDFNQS
jgi:hypothetical protein